MIRLAIRSALAVAAACAVMHAPVAFAEIYRCVDGGRVTYADHACGETVVLLAQRGVELWPPRNGLQVSGREAGGALRGMSPQHVLQALGRPYETTTKLEGGTLIEQWIYRDAQGMRVNFRLGRVVEVSIE